MKTAVIESVCECQVRLRARLDERRHVLEGWAVDRRGRREPAPAQGLPAPAQGLPAPAQGLPAPAQGLGAGSAVFAVGWSCPICTRNTLRSFDAAGLTYREAEASPASVL